MIRNKRGQDLSVTTIILIVLGLVILVAVIVGFTIGWDKLLPWLRSNDNVDVISSQCMAACSGQKTYEFCSELKIMKVEGKPVVENGLSCRDWATKKTGSEDYSKYGIKDCPAITCPTI